MYGVAMNDSLLAAAKIGQPPVIHSREETEDVAEDLADLQSQENEVIDYDVCLAGSLAKKRVRLS